MKNMNKLKMESDTGINGIRDSFRLTPSIQLLVQVPGWQEQKKNWSDSLDTSISEQTCESNLGKSFIFAKNQPHDPSCPCCQGGSSCASAASARGQQRWTWLGKFPQPMAKPWAQGGMDTERVLGVQGMGPCPICVFSAQEWGCYRAPIKVKAACPNEKWKLPAVVCSFLFGFQPTFLTSVLIKSVLP